MKSNKRLIQAIAAAAVLAWPGTAMAQQTVTTDSGLQIIDHHLANLP